MQVANHWRLKAQRYQLIGETCDSCGVKLFPPRDLCLVCEEPAQELYTFTGVGEIYSYSTVYDTATEFQSYTPYIVALIKLEEGPIVTAQMTDIEPANLHIGMPVEMVTRKLRADGPEGLILYGYKFRPAITPTV